MLRVLVATVSLLSLLSANNQRMGTDDDDFGNIQLVSTVEDHGLYNIRPELKENLLKQGITSLEEAGYLENERKTKEAEALIEAKKVNVVKAPGRIFYHPVPVYRYVPYWRHSVSHHVSERHRHFFF